MARLLDLALKPIFSLLSKPGLGNPHSPYEADLMAAGVKPVGILAKGLVSEALLQSISAGHVVVIAEHYINSKGRIYYHKGEENTALRMQKILEDNFVDMDSVSRDEYEEAVELLKFENEESQTLNNLEEGMIKGIKFFKDKKGELPLIFEKAASEKRVSTLDFSRIHDLVVVAQADKIAEGRELNAGYYENAETTSKRIGELLGFTPNDIAWHTGEKYRNPVVLKIMEHTAPLRRYARYETMMAAAPRNI